MEKMNKKRIIILILFIFLCILIIIVGNRLSSSGKIIINDAGGDEICHVSRIKDAFSFDEIDDKYSTFCHHTLIEVRSLLGDDTIKSHLKNGDLIISTTLDKNMQNNLYETALSEQCLATRNYAIAIAGSSGELIAAQSGYGPGIDPDIFESSQYAASAIKPLSVYAPALENGIISESTGYKDAPVHDNWPHNTRKYSGKKQSVADAIKYSNNAIAVRVLMDLGVQNSMDFLEKSFGMDMSSERELSGSNGEDSILADLALGYLKNGIDVVTMLSAYNIFSHNGEYLRSSSLEKITCCDKILYQRERKSKKVISSDTANTMRQMLEGVVSPGGTGEAAAIEGKKVFGKTGTTEDFADNWFIGGTDNYTVAIWYGSKSVTPEQKNNAPKVFYDILNK